MPKLLFAASYRVKYENRTGDNTYTCKLSFFDDRSCTRELTHRMYDCEPPFGGDSTTHTSYEGRWYMRDARPSGEVGDWLHIEELAIERSHWVTSGSGGDRDQHSQTERSPEKNLPIMVELGPLLDGYIIGEHTGAPRRAERLDDEMRYTEGNAEAFLAFIHEQAQVKPPTKQLFFARYSLEYKTPTSHHVYMCRLTFFDDLTCTRELLYDDHDGLESEPHLEGVSITAKTISGVWRVTLGAQEDHLIHIKEPTLKTFHQPISSPHEQGEIIVFPKMLLRGYIKGERTGAPERPWDRTSQVGVSEHCHHEGDKEAFVEFLQRHAERLA